MTEAEVVKQMREHLEGLFPKVCPTCQRRFENLRDFVQSTEQLGPAMPYDAMCDNWTPSDPIGTVTFAHCVCGTTLALSSNGMPLLQLWTLLNWARIETKRRGMTPDELLNHLREEICKQVLSEAGEPPR